jgi:MFS family permease
VLVQGVLMGPLLKRFKPQRLAIMGLGVVGAGLLFVGARLPRAGLMYAVIGINLLGGTVTASVQSLISSAVPQQKPRPDHGRGQLTQWFDGRVGPHVGCPLVGAGRVALSAGRFGALAHHSSFARRCKWVPWYWLCCIYAVIPSCHDNCAVFWSSMDIVLLLKAAVMGVVEGLTEVLPISSTGHLILAGALIGFDDDKAKVFDIAIQTGAIFAVVLVYWQKIASDCGGFAAQL